MRLGSLSAAMLALAVPSPSFAILGGTLDTENPAAVLAVIDFGESVSYCSGVLVGPRRVLTAAHCVNTGPVAALPSAVHVCVGENDASCTEYEVSAIAVHPDWAGPGSTAPDVAVLSLSKAVEGVEPLAVHRTAIDNADRSDVVVIGYGATSVIGTDTGTRRHVLMKLNGIPAPGQFMALATGKGIAGGDGGAPAISSSNEVLGLAMYAASEDGTSPIFQDLGTAYDWIARRIDTSSGGGGCGTPGLSWLSLLGGLAAWRACRRRR